MRVNKGVGPKPFMCRGKNARRRAEWENSCPALFSPPPSSYHQLFIFLNAFMFAFLYYSFIGSLRFFCLVHRFMEAYNEKLGQDEMYICSFMLYMWRIWSKAGDVPSNSEPLTVQYRDHERQDTCRHSLSRHFAALFSIHVDTRSLYSTTRPK
jgi:hypothetical protein